MNITKKQIASAAEKLQSGKFPSTIEALLCYVELLEARVASIESLARGEIRSLPPATAPVSAPVAPVAPIAPPVTVQPAPPVSAAPPAPAPEVPVNTLDT